MHILMGGGQDAKDVTTTSGSSGKFEVLLWHMVYEDAAFRAWTRERGKVLWLSTTCSASSLVCEDQFSVGGCFPSRL